MFRGVLARKATRMLSQPRNRSSAIPANPHAQIPKIAITAQSRAPGVEGVDGNGRLNSTTAEEIAGAAIFRATAADATWLPRLISMANGTRNLIDAVSHELNRIWAPLLR